MNILTSEHAVCVWIPLFPLRCEEARRPDLAGQPTALLAPDDTRRLWQVAPLARRAGVQPGMTVSRAIGLCPALTLLEPDPVHYDERFSSLLQALHDVSPVVEPVELGRAYVGTDGLEGLYGRMGGWADGRMATSPVHAVSIRLSDYPPIRLGWGVGKFVASVAAHRAKPGSPVIVSPVIEPVELGRAYVGTDGLEGLYGRMGGWADGRMATSPVHAVYIRLSDYPPIRLGCGVGKFVASVAAHRAKPGSPVIVNPGEEGQFLASQPIAVLPLDPDTHRRLWQLGLKTLGDVSRLPEDALASQFGEPGRRLWQLAAGRTVEPVRGRELPRPITAALDFPTPVADREILAATLDRLTERALRSPRRAGWRIAVVRARAALEQGGSWLAEVALKDPSADRARITAPLKIRLEYAPPTGAALGLAVEFTRFAPGTAELQLFARDANAAARAGRRRALRAAAEEIKTRFKRTLLYHIVEVQPWSRLPERRYALIDYEH